MSDVFILKYQIASFEKKANSNSGPSLEYQNTRLTLPPAQNNIQQNVQHQHQNNNQPSFVDSSPYFNDLNASFKRLYKSIIINRDIYESGMNTVVKLNRFLR